MIGFDIRLCGGCYIINQSFFVASALCLTEKVRASRKPILDLNWLELIDVNV
jgi:hypothetical protein